MPSFEKMKLIITNDILSEYIEILSEKTSPSVAKNVAELLLNLPNVLQLEVFYRWNLITADPEDNKFVDAAICGGADYIISNDVHFDALSNIEFPAVKCISSAQFLDLLAGG